MTAKQNRISIPLRQRLRRARFSLFPVLIFAVAVALTVVLWGRRNAAPNATGAVDAVRYDVASEIDGWLVWESPQPLDLFDTVTAGEPVARLDDGPTRQALAALEAALAQARQEVVAAEAELRLDDELRQQDRVIESRRLALDVEDIRLTVLDHKAELQAERIHLQRREEQMTLAKRLWDGGAATELEYLAAKLERDVVAEHIKGLELLVSEAQTQFAAAQERAASLPEAAKADVAAALGPLREAAAAQEALVRELEQRVASLVIRAPVTGQITAVWRRPGQSVRRGDPIITISDPVARRVISYVRADQRLEPEPGMAVIVRSRSNPSKVHRGRVTQVGAQVELVPLQHQRVPNVFEWGQAVGIDLPPDTTFRPGEMVDLSIKR